MDQASKTAGEILLPLAGKGIVAAISAAAISVDLTLAGEQSPSAGFESTNPPQSMGGEVANSSSGGGTVQSLPIVNPTGALGRWIDITADGADIGLIAGPTLASVTGANAPALADNGGAGTAGICQRIFVGTTRAFYVRTTTRFLGIVGSGAGQVRIFPSGAP